MLNNNFDSYTFNFSGIDKLTFVPDDYNGQKSFMVDNMTLTSAVPEPPTYALFAAGFGLIGRMMHRRNNRKASPALASA